MTTNEKTGLLLKSNGDIEEHTIDMTPHTNNIGKLLNDKVSFIGQLLREPERTNAVLMFGKNAQEKGLEKNKCVLPLPFEDDIYGDIFIIGMNSDSDPESFLIDDLDEYDTNYETLYKSKYHDL
tara:strand:+ start:2446 stop:2817 length:372 start_codon:yes stop_codon:yes gene_type:complete